MKIILTTLFSCCCLSAFAQLSNVLPEKPTTGETVSLSYNFADPHAVLKRGAEVYARVINYMQDGGVIKFHLPMRGSTDELKGSFKLREQTASFKVEFYTLNKDDDKAGKTLMVFTSDRSKPVAGAYLEAMFSDDPDGAFKKEILNYPTNYLAYARYFNAIAMTKDPDSGKVQIQAFLRQLGSAYNSDKKPVSEGLLTALCVGFAKSGNLASGKKYLYELFDRFPQTQETAFAFSIYNYEYYKSSSKDAEDDVRAKLKDIFIRYPAAPLSRDGNVYYYLAKEPGISVHDFEHVLLPVYQDSLVSYHALTNLPEVYLDHNQKLDTAEALLKQGIVQFQTGIINHQFRLNNSHYQLYVPLLLIDLVKINLLQKNYPAAIINSSAAVNILAGSNAEGNLMPLLLPLRAAAYQKSGNMNLALEDYKKIYRSGKVEALDSMRLIFDWCNVKEKTFENFMATLKFSDSSKPISNLTMAPDITATDLKGKTVRLSNLKGKLVVINIWGIGCGPCIAEMPELNKLVKQFPDRNKVVFLGITGDKTQSLIKFLRVHAYDYTVLNNAANLSEKFNTNSLPVHIVIGRQGEIISKSIGARADIREYLEGLININL